MRKLLIDGVSNDAETTASMAGAASAKACNASRTIPP